MTKQQAIKKYKASWLHHIETHELKYMILNLPMRLDSWDTFKSMLLSDGRITKRQYNIWAMPSFKSPITQNLIIC